MICPAPRPLVRLYDPQQGLWVGRWDETVRRPRWVRDRDDAVKVLPGFADRLARRLNVPVEALRLLPVEPEPVAARPHNPYGGGR